ncbi:hypothetical protein [Roseovarius arcticus]|uniref:hypothetical protein n=1 Tax=Roseovarius arcticus TaxID=2547404 RepID=UPI0014869527|nr:hypothetical protein [Roseovarius arcticus]
MSLARSEKSGLGYCTGREAAIADLLGEKQPMGGVINAAEIGEKASGEVVRCPMT